MCSPGDCVFRCASSLFAAPALSRAARSNWLQAHMHFRFYLLIAALLLIGLEAAYSLYQLAGFVL
jgi:hypothetical protein